MRSTKQVSQKVALFILSCAIASSIFAGVYRDSKNHFRFTTSYGSKTLYRSDLKAIYSDTMLTNQYWKDVIGMVLLGDTEYVSYPFVTVRKEPLEADTRLSFVTFVTGVFWGLQNNKASNPANMNKDIDRISASVSTDMDLDGGIRGRVITKYYLGKNTIISLTCYSELPKAQAALPRFLKLANSFKFDASYRYVAPPIQSKQTTAPNAKRFSGTSKDEIELSNGWRRLAVSLLGTIDIPPSLEVQRGFYKELHDALTSDSTGTAKTLILQQHGLNELKPGAQSRYARVLIDNIELGDDGIGSLKGILTFTDTDLEELAQSIKEQVVSQPGISILSFAGASQQSVNGMNAIQVDYRRRLNDNPIVTVSVYLFPNEGYLHRVTISYREKDEHFWKTDMADFIQRINITERQPITKLKKNNPMSLLYGENWSAALLLSLLVTWTIGLFPPLMIRYVIRRKALKKWSSVVISLAFWVINIGIFTALESKSKTHTALTIVMFVSYFILRAGSKKQNVV